MFSISSTLYIHASLKLAFLLKLIKTWKSEGVFVCPASVMCDYYMRPCMRSEGVLINNSKVCMKWEARRKIPFSQETCVCTLNDWGKYVLKWYKLLIPSNQDIQESKSLTKLNIIEKPANSKKQEKEMKSWIRPFGPLISIYLF